jgi:hypothetical protein
MIYSTPMKPLFCIVIFILLTSSSFAQDTVSYVSGPANKKTYDPRFAVRLSPQHAIVNAMKVDFEYKTANLRSVIISPSIFLGENDNAEQTGIGTDLAYRIYLEDKDEAMAGAYLDFTAGFQYNRMKYEGLNWVTEINEDGLEVIRQRTVPIHTDIYRFGGAIIIGIQSPLSKYLFIDSFIGYGLRKASIDGPRKFDSDILSPGFEGVEPRIGIKFGVYLK